MSDTYIDEDHQSANGPFARFSKTVVFLVTLLGSLTVLVLHAFQISDYVVNKPEVVQPFVTHFDRWIGEPIIALFQLLAKIFAWDAVVQIVGDPQSLQFISPAVTIATSAVVLYGSALALAKLYDLAATARSLRGGAVFLLTVLFIPVGALGIVHLCQTYFHIVLSPGAQSLLDGYRAIVHPLVEAIYWLPFHFLHLGIPSWLKDLATISVVSVGMSRKAFLGTTGRSPGGFAELDWPLFWEWVDDLLDSSKRDWFEFAELVPQLLSLFAAQFLGRLVLVLSFGWRWLAERVAAITFVVLRGVMLVGLLYPFQYTLYLVRPTDEVDDPEVLEAHRATRMYVFYFVLTVAFIVWFVWAWKQGA